MYVHMYAIVYTYTKFYFLCSIFMDLNKIEYLKISLHTPSNNSTLLGIK